MSEDRQPADAFVFFGATGDLAYKKIFPSLYAMRKRGRLDIPVISVAHAGWGLDQLKARGVQFIDWSDGALPEGQGLAPGETIGRFVCSFATRPEDVERLLAIFAEA